MYFDFRNNYLHPFPFPFCGGTLRSSDTVLTAAHCSGIQLNFHVKLGMVDIKRNDDRRIAKPIKWIQHPDYKSNYDNDFAIIKLSENVEFRAGNVGPACLPDPATSYDDVDATVTGWGKLKDKGKQSRFLQKVSKRITTVYESLTYHIYMI